MSAHDEARVQREDAISVALFEAAAICRLVEIAYVSGDGKVPETVIQGAMKVAERLILEAEEEVEQCFEARRSAAA